MPRINANQFGAMAFGILCATPKVHVAGDRVAAPNHNQFGFRKELGLHAELATQCVDQTFATGRGTNGAIQQRCAHLVEKPRRHGLALHPAHGARIAVGQHGLWVL